MALPTSGPLSLNDIKGEFGGPTSPSLGDYYAGGTYVPAGTSGTNGPVPSSGPISISNFYGTSSIVVDFSDRFVMGAGFGSSNAGYQIIGTSGGGLLAGNDYEFTNFSFPFSPNQWITPTSQAANYEVYATVSGGPLATGTVNAWIAVSTNPAWSVEAFGSGAFTSAGLTFQVRRIGTGTVLDTWAITLEATAF
jgi:hypothetical protein